MMATNTERSNKAVLHNFTMPRDLRWGNQRFLRCMKVNSDGQISPLRRFTTTTTGAHSSQHHHHHHHHHRSISIQHRHAATRDREKRESSDDGSRKVGSTPPPTDHGIAAVREKVMLDLQTAADKMKDAIFKEGLAEGVASVAVSPPLPLAVFPTKAVELPHGETHRPWSLRTRRAACKTTALNGFSSGRNGCGGFTRSDFGGGKELTVDASMPMPISGFSPVSADKSPLERSGGEKLSVALSKRAIEEDFLTMVNHRPPRRPKKRAKFIQKQLDTLFPGLWLTEVTADMYKVTEPAP